MNLLNIYINRLVINKFNKFYDISLSWVSTLGLSSLNIKAKKYRKHILEALSDTHMSKILESTSMSEKSAVEIIQEYNIPHSSVYRKINQLLRFGLLCLYKSEIHEGKKISFYKSTFRSIQINYVGSSEYTIDAVSNDDVLERISQHFYEIDS